jgi:hypothetical protein
MHLFVQGRLDQALLYLNDFLPSSKEESSHSATSPVLLYDRGNHPPKEPYLVDFPIHPLVPWKQY